MDHLERLLVLLKGLLPPGNIIPRSKYLLFQLLGIEVSRFERHVCKADCYVFPDVHPDEYELHAGEQCPLCQRPRFERRGGGTLSPVKKFYVIPIQEQIAMLKRNPGFDDSVTKMWNDLQVRPSFYDSFWGGSLARPYLLKMDDLDDFSRILVFSLGLDGVQAFGHGNYEVWPVGLRVWNLHPEERSSKGFILLAALIPGPKPPQHLSPYLEPILQEMVSSRNPHGGLRTWNAGKEREERV